MHKRELLLPWFLLGLVSVVTAITFWAWQSGQPFLQPLRCLMDYKLTDTIIGLSSFLAAGAVAAFNQWQWVPPNLRRILQNLYGGISFALLACVLAAGIALSPPPQKECFPALTHPPTPSVRPTSTVKATPTLSPTPTPRPPTPTYTSDNCSRQVGDRFGGIWNAIQQRPSAKNRLECPLNGAHTEYGAAQKFEHGYMFWREGQDLVYVLYHDDNIPIIYEKYPASIIYEKYWPGVDPEKVGYTPPLGLLEPVRGFGKVWREHLGGPSAQIGWATESEHSAPNLVVQDFENGMIFWEDNVGNRVFFSTGWWEQW